MAGFIIIFSIDPNRDVAIRACPVIIDMFSIKVLKTRRALVVFNVKSGVFREFVSHNIFDIEVLLDIFVQVKKRSRKVRPIDMDSETGNLFIINCLHNRGF